MVHFYPSKGSFKGMIASKGCEACGKTGIEGALLYVKEKGLKAKLVDYKTSAQTCGDDRRVVGYGGYVFISFYLMM